MTHRRDLTGLRFGRLVVVSYSRYTGSGSTLWNCVCDCGTEKEIAAGSLTAGRTNSCGCYRREFVTANNTTHGMSKRGCVTTEYSMWISAKERAKKHSLPFNLDLEDIVIPEYRPVISYIKINKSNKVVSMDSPTLDRLIPELGYVKGNVQVISHRANSIKSNATYDEIQLVADWLRETVNGK